MPLFLAGLLVRGGAVAPDVMEDALQRQVLYGGSLDTNLLEIGAIDELTLAPYLARASGLPLAPSVAFDGVEPRVRRAFPARLAERHGVVPFRLEGRTLEVACCYPVEGSLIDEISFMLSLILRPHAAFEFRVRLAVERLYGHTAAQRFHAIARRFGVEVRAPEPEATPPPPLPPPIARAQAAALRREEKVGAARAKPPSWTKEEALALLHDARDRDTAIEIVLRFSRRVFEYTSAFVVLGGNVIGWDAIGPDPDARRRAEQVALPVDAPSILRTVVETGGRYLGPIPPDEHHLALLEALGRRPPRSAYLQPVSIGERVVAVLFCDNGENVVSPVQVAQVMQVCQALAEVLQGLIRARRGALPAPDAPEPVRMALPGTRAETPVPEPLPDVTPAGPVFSVPRRRPPPPPADLTPGPYAPVVIAQPPAPVVVNAPPAPSPWEAPRWEAPPAPSSWVRSEAKPVSRSPAPQARAPASSAPTERARRAVEALLSARNETDRSVALDAVTQAGSAAADVLVALLPGPGTGPLTAAAASAPSSPLVVALARLGDAAVPALVRGRNARSAGARFSIAALLLRSHLPAARDALLALADDTSPEVAALARS